MGLPCGSDGKESACNAGDLGSVPGLGRSPGEGHGDPLQYSCLENLHGQRSLAGYSLPLGLALGSPIFPSGCEGKLGVALESLQGLRVLN